MVRLWMVGRNDPFYAPRGCGRIRRGGKQSGALTLVFGQSHLHRAQVLILDQQDTLSSIFLLKRGVDFKCYMYLAIPLLPFIAVIKH
jgi:hypothetical protein